MAVSGRRRSSSWRTDRRTSSNETSRSRCTSETRSSSVASSSSPNTVTVEARSDGDGYPEFARQAFHLVIHGARPATVLLGGERLDPSDRGFVIPNSGQDFAAGFDA